MNLLLKINKKASVFYNSVWGLYIEVFLFYNKYCRNACSYIGGILIYDIWIYSSFHKGTERR